MQTMNYYRFWLLMVGTVCLASVHSGIAFLLALTFIGLGVVLPVFSKQILAMGSKIETKVNDKVEKKTDDKSEPAEVEENKADDEDKSEAA